MYETSLSRMIMQLPPAQMANQDGDAGMETILWDINIIPNELDNGYLMLPPGVLHMSALGRFGRFTLFSPRVSHSKHLPVFCFVLCCVLGLGVCCFVVFLFPVLQVIGIPNSPRSFDLDDRQGFIASSAMQQKKKSACYGSKPMMWFTRLGHEYSDSQFEVPAGEPGTTSLFATHPLNNSTQYGLKAQSIFSTSMLCPGNLMLQRTFGTWV